MIQSTRDTTRAVLFDRDGSLIHDGDRERLVEDARAAIARLREAGLLVAVVKGASPSVILAACDALGVRTDQAVVIGDVADIEAAAGAGARGILVPTSATRKHEILAAEERAATLTEAVARIITERGAS